MLARHFTWGYFHDISPIFFIKAYGFYFCVGVIFAKKTKARKTRKLPPRKNFHVYSNYREKPFKQFHQNMHNMYSKNKVTSLLIPTIVKISRNITFRVTLNGYPNRYFSLVYSKFIHITKVITRVEKRPNRWLVGICCYSTQYTMENFNPKHLKWNHFQHMIEFTHYDNK